MRKNRLDIEAFIRPLSDGSKALDFDANLISYNPYEHVATSIESTITTIEGAKVLSTQLHDAKLVVDRFYL